METKKDKTEPLEKQKTEDPRRTQEWERGKVPAPVKDSPLPQKDPDKVRK